MRNKLSAVLVLAGSLLLAGCFDVEQSLVLDKNLAGKAGFSMKVNFEPMVLMMLRMQREMQDQKGEPTAAEIEKAKQDFLASKKSEEQPDMAKEKAEMQKNLPPGIKLLDASMKDEGLQMAVNIGLGFDHVSKLKQVNLSKPKEGEEQAAPGQQNPFDQPFGDLDIVEQGNTILITSKPTNPMEKQEEQMGGEMTPDMEKQMEEAFKGLRIAWKIQAPFEVIEHNATRKEGNTLIWEYTLDTFKKMKPGETPPPIRVKYKKG